MTHEQGDDQRASERTRLTKVRRWARERQGALLVAGAGAGAVATVVVMRSRGVKPPESLVANSLDAARELAAAQAAASSRVASEFAALGPEYVRDALKQSFQANPRRRNMHWTSDELEVLADPAKTALAKALELSRSFYGVQWKSIEQGFSSAAP